MCSYFHCSLPDFPRYVLDSLSTTFTSSFVILYLFILMGSSIAVVSSADGRKWLKFMFNLDEEYFKATASVPSSCKSIVLPVSLMYISPQP